MSTPSPGGRSPRPSGRTELRPPAARIRRQRSPIGYWLPEERPLQPRLEGAELMIVPGAGHAVVLEKPGEINTALLGFLDKNR